MRRLLNVLYSANAWAAAFFLAAIFAIILAQIVLDLADRLASRFLGESFGLMIPSYAEFASYLMAASMFLGFACALNHGTHVRVTLAIRLLPPAIRRTTEFAATAIATGASSFFAWRATVMVYESWLYEDQSYGLIVIPMWVPQAPMAIGLTVLSIAFIDRLVGVLAGRWVADEDEVPPTPVAGQPGE
jgi:TRAP-type C4-dicarboxylate transport system permease small subunit